MPCIPFTIGDGFGVICTRGRRGPPPPCKFCPTQPKATPSTLLCDGDRDGRSCDKPICARHATHVGPDVDLCPACVAEGRRARGPQQLALNIGPKGAW